MKNRRKARLAAALLAGLLALSGCRLAQPEAEHAAGDRFAGLYVVRSQGYDGGFFDNPSLTDYGSMELDAGDYGSVSLPRQVLIGREEAGSYVFPGLEDGYSLFALEMTEENGSTCSTVVSNMAPGEEGTRYAYTDEGTSAELSGTIYYGPPLGAKSWDSYGSDTVWHAYRVYQTPEGVPYLDGSGNSYSGGGSMSFREQQTDTESVDGQETTHSVSAAVNIQEVPRLEALTVTQFSADNQLLRTQAIPLGEDMEPILCGADAAWVLVTETGGDGTAKRTVYNVPVEGEDPVSHMVVYLDPEGLGLLSWLEIR